jgi:hypothetical protein
MLGKTGIEKIKEHNYNIRIYGICLSSSVQQWHTLREREQLSVPLNQKSNFTQDSDKGYKN